MGPCLYMVVHASGPFNSCPVAGDEFVVLRPDDDAFVISNFSLPIRPEYLTVDDLHLNRRSLMHSREEALNGLKLFALRISSLLPAPELPPQAEAALPRHRGHPRKFVLSQAEVPQLQPTRVMITWSISSQTSLSQ